MSEYVDGELSGRERRRLERHTDVCPECRRALRTLVVVVSELRRLRHTERGKVASQVVERLRGQLDQELGVRNGR